MNLILYTTHCPQCKFIEMTLKKKNIPYTECTDVEEMRSKGITTVPVLSIDGKLVSGKELFKEVNSL